MPGTVLRYLGFGPHPGLVSSNIAAQCPGARLGMPGGRGFPSDPACLTSSVLRYLDFGSTRGLISFNIAAHIFRGSGEGCGVSN